MSRQQCRARSLPRVAAAQPSNILARTHNQNGHESHEAACVPLHGPILLSKAASRLLMTTVFMLPGQRNLSRVQLPPPPSLILVSPCALYTPPISSSLTLMFIGVKMLHSFLYRLYISLFRFDGRHIGCQSRFHASSQGQHVGLALQGAPSVPPSGTVFPLASIFN